MRILLLNTSFPPELRSAADICYELGQELVRRGHSVTVVTGFPRVRLSDESLFERYRGFRFSCEENWNGIKVVRVRAFPYPEQSLLARGIDAFLTPLAFFLGCQRVGKQDLSWVYSPPLTLGLAALDLKWQRGVACVFNAQDIYPQTLIDLGLMKNRLLIKVFEWIERLVYRHVDQIVVHSNGNREYLVTRKLVPAEKIAVIPNWVSADAAESAEDGISFRREHGLEDKFVVSYAGVMGYAQDLSAIIDAAYELKPYADIVFLLVGEGVREKAWKSRVEQLELPNVKFLPLQPQPTYLALLNASAVGLVPLTDQLRTPAVPGKLSRIMGTGRPVIAIVNSAGDATEIIKEANCGYIISPGNSQRLAEAVLELYRDPALVKRLGENGRRYAEQHFSLSAGVTAYENLFRKIVPSQTMECC